MLNFFNYDFKSNGAQNTVLVSESSILNGFVKMFYCRHSSLTLIRRTASCAVVVAHATIVLIIFLSFQKEKNT